MSAPGEGRVQSGDSAFRAALLAAGVEALAPAWVATQAELEHVNNMLDAVLPVLADWIKPHRWDKDYPESAPSGPCHGSTPDTFYAGVLHAAAVVRDLLPPKVRDTDV